MSRRLSLVLDVLAVGAVGVALALGKPPADPDGDPLREHQAKRLGRTYTEKFYSGKLEEIWGQFSDEMKGALGTINDLRRFRQLVTEQLGEEEGIVAEKVSRAGGGHLYVRQARFEKYSEIIEVVWVFDERGTIDGFVIHPQEKEADSPYLDYQTKTELRLPFDGEWYVFWGGRTLKENYHAAVVDQRFACDIIIMKYGSSHSGDGKSNKQYYCYGRPILAPGSGVVVEVVDGVADNIPGEMNAMQPVGNHVVIDHGNGEFSFLAHLQEGSVKVGRGQEVTAGDLLGLCGNSGNSSEPHLHYHLQTSGVFQKGQGLPAQFRHYLANGEIVPRGEPTKGQLIEHQPAPSP